MKMSSNYLPSLVSSIEEALPKKMLLDTNTLRINEFLLAIFSAFLILK